MTLKISLLFVSLLLLTGCEQTASPGRLSGAEQTTLNTGYTAGCRQAPCNQGSQAGAEVGNGDDSLVVRTWSGSGTPPPAGIFDRAQRSPQTNVIIINRGRTWDYRVRNGRRQMRTSYGWCYTYRNSDGVEACL